MISLAVVFAVCEITLRVSSHKNHYFEVSVDLKTIYYAASTEISYVKLRFFSVFSHIINFMTLSILRTKTKIF